MCCLAVAEACFISGAHYPVISGRAENLVEIVSHSKLLAKATKQVIRLTEMLAS